MNIEYTHKRENGDTIAIEIRVSGEYSTKIKYRIKDVGYKKKGKRKFDWKARLTTENYIYRALKSTEEKAQYWRDVVYSIVTEEEIQEALEYAYSYLSLANSDIEFYPI